MLASLSIKLKTTIGLVILTILLLVMTVISYHSLNQLHARNKLFAETLIQAEGLVLNADRDLYQALVALKDYVYINTDPAKNEKIRGDYTENMQQALDRMNQFLSIMKDYPEVTTKLTKFHDDYNQFKELADKMFVLKDANADLDTIRTNSKIELAQFKVVREHYNAGTDAVEALTQTIAKESDQASSAAKSLLFMIAAISIAVGLVLSWLVPKIIINSIQTLQAKVSDMNQGEGDLMSRIPVHSHDELGKLSGSMNQFLDKLQHLIVDVKNKVGTLDSASAAMNNVAHTAGKLSQDQYHQLDSLVTAFTEINHAVRDIAQHAQSAASQTEDAQKGTQSGMLILQKNVESSQTLSHIIHEASGSIQNLATESERITSVLDVIRGIAEQTNLLALNAAIEAARAGEQGRGFAVVADEVRTLASRTQQSTADIQNMITALKAGVQTSVAAMEKGSAQMDETLNMVSEASHLLSDIQGKINVAHDMTFQIAAATEQQSTVINDINQGITELNSVTQKQSELAGRASDAGNNLVQLTHQLNDALSHFRA